MLAGAGKAEKGAIVDVRQRGENRWNKILKDDASRGGRAKDLWLSMWLEDSPEVKASTCTLDGAKSGIGRTSNNCPKGWSQPINGRAAVISK